MKKIVLCGLVALFSGIHAPKAEEDFFDNLIVDDEMKQEVKTNIEKENAQIKAGEILDQKPLQLKIDANNQFKVKKTTVEEIVPIERELAPFGLKWLATKDEILELQVKLEPYTVKDSPQSYMATNLPKPVKAMREVLISFGDENALWRISGYGKFLDDDDKATKGLEEYHKFYDMLEEKYGNAEEFYTPYVKNVEETTTNEDGSTSKVIKQYFMQIGDEGFKQRLMSGEATLYATFENDHIGVTLALLADGQGQTYIIIDYKNLKKNEIDLKEIYEAL